MDERGYDRALIKSFVDEKNALWEESTECVLPCRNLEKNIMKENFPYNLSFLYIQVNYYHWQWTNLRLRLIDMYGGEYFKIPINSAINLVGAGQTSKLWAIWLHTRPIMLAIGEGLSEVESHMEWIELRDELGIVEY